MENTHFLLNAKTLFFINWLNDHLKTYNHSVVSYQVKDGMIAHLSLYFPEDFIIGDVGIKTVLVKYSLSYEYTKTDMGSGYVDLVNGIEFVIIPLDETRTEVKAQVFNKQLEKIYREIIAVISKLWTIQYLTPNPETAELKKDTLQNINQISETDKKIIDLWNDGYCDSDIAQIVGLAAGTIQNKISRLRQKLGPEIVKKHYS